MSGRPPLSPFAADAVLFDLDGVLTDTAAVHRRAWATMFNEYLGTAAPGTRPYDDDDYFALVDGKPRADGVRAVLVDRGIELPEGDAADPPGAATVNGLGNRKNDRFAAILERDGVAPFDGSVRLVQALSAAGVPMAVVSSSRNARPVLAATGLLDRFAVVVDGVVAARDALAGKPAPDMFLAAARALGAEPESTVAVEDAVSGVASAHAGGFWVVGVDRGVGAAALTEAGADEVVDDVGELVSASAAVPSPSPASPSPR